MTRLHELSYPTAVPCPNRHVRPCKQAVNSWHVFLLAAFRGAVVHGFCSLQLTCYTLFAVRPGRWLSQCNPTAQRALLPARHEAAPASQPPQCCSRCAARLQGVSKWTLLPLQQHNSIVRKCHSLGWVCTTRGKAHFRSKGHVGFIWQGIKRACLCRPGN